jgi:hypothetical protein
MIRSHILYLTSDATIVAVAGNRLAQRRRAKNITRIDETIHADTAASYREAFKKRRCLIPADGFYDCNGVLGGKIPYSIGMKDDSPFVFARLVGGLERPCNRRMAPYLSVPQPNPPWVQAR